ncbi:MAG: transglycosylase domain-containing protein [Vicinamibacteria bacterium]|nr:transglycosylase domain-containing protein [Vicinamibacteria bacterium]
MFPTPDALRKTRPAEEWSLWALRLEQHVRSATGRFRVWALRAKARWGRSAILGLAAVAFPPLVLATGLTYHVYFDRSQVPDLDAFVRFQLPMTGEVRDARGSVLIEIAREYRREVSYDDVPVILRQAILATEDRNFFSHRGIEYRSLPRVVQKAVQYTLAAWWKGGRGSQVRFPQGGSTLTQQLVRGYFLRDETSRENGKDLLHRGLGLRLLSSVLGVAASNQLCRKLEEIRLAFWLEEQMQKRYGSQELAKREIFARYASFIYLGNGRYGFAAASEYYFDKPLGSYTAQDAGKAALLVGISKSPRDYAPVPGAPKPLRRRNEILAQMASHGYIPKGLAKICQDEPVVVAPRPPTETEAPAAVQNVFEELKRLDQGRFGIDDLIEGRIGVSSTVDARVQAIVNEALEGGLVQYEKRHPKSRGLIQGSVMVLRNADAAILAQAGGRRVYKDRAARYFDLNRATGSLRQPGSAWKPLVYLAAFIEGMNLDSPVLDEPIGVPDGSNGEIKWISNYDHEFKGTIPLRQALAESRNAVAVGITRAIGLEKVIRLAKALGIRTPIQPYLTTALGASEVRLLELAGIYRAMASGLLAEPHAVARVTDASGRVLYDAPQASRDFGAAGLSVDALSEIQEGLRGVVRLPTGTAHELDRGDFPIPVMGKTGTTSDFRDALFVGSTYGPSGITVAVRIGFDDNHALGSKETGSRAALPIFRTIMLRVYKDALVGPVPRFPRRIESRIDAYLSEQALLVRPAESPLAPVQAAPEGGVRP